MLNIKRKKDYIILLGVSLIAITIVYYGLLTRMHYSVDSYHLIRNQNAFWYLQNGRYSWCYLTIWFEKLGMNLVLDQRFFLVLAICAFSISSFLITITFCNIADVKSLISKVLILCAASLAWANVFVEEFLLFPESGISAAVGALSVSVSAILLLSERRGWKILLSVALLLIGVGCYQSFIGCFLAISLIGGCLKTISEKKRYKREAILHWFITLCIAAFAAIFNVLIVRYLISINFIADPGRGADINLETIFSNLKQVLLYQTSMLFNADGLLPPLVLPTLLFFMTSLYIILFRRKKDNIRFELLSAFLVSYFAAFAPHYIEKDILLTPRSNLAIWSVFGIFLAVLICFFDSSEIKRVSIPSRIAEQVLSVTTVAMILWFALNVVCMNDISYDLFISNVQDRAYALQVAEKISSYEAVNNVDITQIAIVYDKNVNNQYPNVRYQNHELCRRIMNTQYSNYEMINYLSGQNLHKVDMPDTIYKQYFAEKDWNSLDLDEQLKIVDNTAYLALY